MTILAVTLLVLIVGGLAVWFSQSIPSGDPFSGRFLGISGALIAFAPLFLAGLLLYQGQDRIDNLYIDYVGKTVRFDEENGISIGGSARETRAAEDLHASRLAPRAATILLADADIAEEVDGVNVGQPFLQLASPSPVVSLDGRMINRYPLEPGDRLVLNSVDPPLELEFGHDGLERDGQHFELEGRWASRLRSSTGVVLLSRILANLASDREVPQLRSFLHRGRPGEGWHLVVRESDWSLVRDGAETATFVERWRVPAEEFQMRLQVAWGTSKNRYLRTLRDDRIRFSEGLAEIRFADPERHLVPLGTLDEPLELGLVVPSADDRREQLIELDEPSERFRGLAMTLRYEPVAGDLSFSYLGYRREVELEELYSVGEDRDQLILTLSRPGFPEHLLFDLFLLSLFVAVFLGPGLKSRPSLLMVFGSVGMLLALRLLFSHRVAWSPPHFMDRTYAEARLALWLVPAVILLGWTLAKLLREIPNGALQSFLWRWPLSGLLVASMGIVFTVWGSQDLVVLAAIPLLGIVAILALNYASRGRGVRGRVQRWNDDGFPWNPLALLVGGVVICGVRWASSEVGMPETLRIPVLGFRVLWTVIQLPVCVVLVALAFQAIVENRESLFHYSNLSEKLIKQWLLGTLLIGVFAGLAYFLVGFLVRDTGLLLAQSLPIVLALLLLVTWPRFLVSFDVQQKLVYGAGVFLACLPIVLFLVLNLQPNLLVRAIGWGDGKDIAAEAASLSSNRAQQLFRLYMLARPDELRDIGLRPSEQVAVHYDTLNVYAQEAGMSGGGYMSSELPRHLGVTYLSDLVPMVFALADFGVLGVLSLALLYVMCLVACVLALGRAATDRLGQQGTWIATLAMMAFALPSLYMLLANLNLVLFTGKNCGLLALNSVSDVLESSAFLGLAAFGLGLSRRSF